MSPILEKLIELARKIKMTPAERAAQRLSFTCGNSHAPREMVEEAARKLRDLRWVDQSHPSPQHMLWQLLVDGNEHVVATVERFSETMPTYANVFAPRRARRSVSLYDFNSNTVEPSVEEQDRLAREWAVSIVLEGEAE